MTTKVQEKPIQQTANAANRLDRPRRRPFENPGRLKFPEIPGYHSFVAAIDDPNLPNEYERAEDVGYTPVKAEEIGYHKRGLRPLKEGDFVYVNLGKNVKGILMKLPIELYEQDIADSIKHNNEVLFSRKDSLDSSAHKDLVMTEGELIKGKS
jgi:hypothetical protein